MPEELAALELLEQEVEPRLVLERDVEAHDRRVVQRAEQLLLTVQVGQLRLALDVALLDGLERVGGRRAPVPHAQHAARHAATEYAAELQVGQGRPIHPTNCRWSESRLFLPRDSRWLPVSQDFFGASGGCVSRQTLTAPTRRMSPCDR